MPRAHGWLQAISWGKSAKCQCIGLPLVDGEAFEKQPNTFHGKPRVNYEFLGQSEAL